MAFEILLSKGTVTTSSDIWLLTFAICKTLTETKVWQSDDRTRFYQRLKK